jgi:hypothetical protein
LNCIGKAPLRDAAAAASARGGTRVAVEPVVAELPPVAAMPREQHRHQIAEAPSSVASASTSSYGHRHGAARAARSASRIVVAEVQYAA